MGLAVVVAVVAVAVAVAGAIVADFAASATAVAAAEVAAAAVCSAAEVLLRLQGREARQHYVLSLDILNPHWLPLTCPEQMSRCQV